MINLIRLVSLFFLLMLLVGRNNVQSYSRQYHYKQSIVTALKHLKETLYIQPKAFYSGLYPSYMHFYSFGTNDQIYKREIFCDFDNDYFFTGWIMELLLESYELTVDNDDDLKLDITDASIENTVRALMHYFHDTSHGSGVPLINFYSIYSKHLNHREASDFDDSSLNLLLHSKLKRFKHEFPRSYSRVSDTDPQLLMPLFVKYSYQPYSHNINKNMIDPRSYYWLRQFIDDHRDQQSTTNNDKNNVMIITTWIINYHEYSRTKPLVMGYPNQIDLGVITNSILGIVHTILTNPDTYTKWTDRNLLKLLTDSTNLIKWVIDTNWINKRPDLLLIYYPSMNTYYWFLSRVTNFLTNADLDYLYHNDQLVYNTIIHIRHTFTLIMREQITKKFIGNITRDGRWIYYDDGLGSQDEINYHEDRLFTTSMIVDMLINTWTKKISEYKISLEWIENTPEAVIEIVKHASIFINDHITDKSYPKEQAFFSLGFGSNFTKTARYPYTYFCYLNGTCPNSTKFTIEADYGDGIDPILAVNHPIDNKKYEQLLLEQVNFDGMPEYVNQWNSSDLNYYSSPSLTYSMSILALVKSRTLLNEYCSDNAYLKIYNHGSNSCLDEEKLFHTQTTEMKEENDSLPEIADFSLALDLKCSKQFCYYKQHYLPLN